MDSGLFIILLVFFGMVFVFWRGKVAREHATEQQNKFTYKELWYKSGVKFKWWILVLNYAGNMFLLKEIVSLRHLHGAGLAQWQFGVGFTYMACVMGPSILVILCTIFFIMFELRASISKQKVLYLVLAIISVVFPLLLMNNASKFIG